MSKTKIRKNKDLSTAIIYTRVSSKDQLEGFSLESQENVCRKFAEKNGLTVIRLFREEGESAKTANRTELRKMVDYAKRNEGKIGKLIIYKVDRLARNKEDYYALKVVFKRYGIALLSATENIDDDPIGKLMEGMLAAIAEFDNDIRTQRTTEGMETRLNNGYWTWSAPIGYINGIDITGKRILIKDKQRAPLVKILFEEAAKGIYTFRQLATKINNLGLRSRHNKKIAPQLVVKILKNPLHCARIEVSEWNISVDAKHEAIVSRELWEKIQARLRGDSSATRKMSRNRGNVHTHMAVSE